MGQINARDWIFEVSDGAPTTPAWLELANVESFTLNPSENEESADTTHFGSGGVHESQAMQRGASLAITGKVVSTAGARDAGQARVDELGALVGDASLGEVRFRHVDDTEWTVWDAWVTPGEQGGGTNEKTTWSCTFHRSGAATVAAVV